MDSSLSGSSDDKCPFIYEDRMVFASDRDGGFGGYDLYIVTLKTENGLSRLISEKRSIRCLMNTGQF